MLNRPILLFAALFCGALLSGQTKGQTKDPATPPPQIVFVCEHGAAKSVIAAAEFNRRAEENGLPHRAVSRGTNPDPVFAPGVVADLNKDGLSVPAGKPRLLADADVKNAARVITLAASCLKR